MEKMRCSPYIMHSLFSDRNSFKHALVWQFIIGNAEWFWIFGEIDS